MCRCRREELRLAAIEGSVPGYPIYILLLHQRHDRVITYFGQAFNQNQAVLLDVAVYVGTFKALASLAVRYTTAACVFAHSEGKMISVTPQ